MADADDLSGTVIDDRYKVIEAIAQGAMGSVYRGERLKLGRAVAIKVMHQELPDELASRQRFEREAKLMALLEHPNCVSVIDYGVHDEKPFLVMDLVRGTSLIDMMEKSGPLDIGKSADIIRQVLSGLAHAHELGIVHRDIKPANIMLTEKAGLGMQVRILDFGLARMSETSTKLTTGIVVGTPNYMAPEQCKGSDIDARTDIYAVGVMLFEMLTGRKPFVADDPIAVVRKHLLEPPPTMKSIEPRVEFGELEAVVAKALAKVPADRYASAVDMSKAVESAAAKVSKTSAAALFARAVPENPGAPANSPQATMSGWSVPQDARSTAIPSSQVPGVGPVGAPSIAPPSTPLPAPISGAIPSTESGPTSGVASVSNASGPFTGVAQVTDGGSGPAFASSTPTPGGWSASSPGGPPASPAATPAKPGALPPLPQAKPYQAPAPRPGYVPGAAAAAAASAVAAAQAATAGAPTTTMESLQPSHDAPPVPASDTSGAAAVPSADPTGVAARATSANEASPPSDVSAPVDSAAPATPLDPAISSGTPIATLDVPPTRQSTLPPTAPFNASSSNDRPIPQLPLTKKQLMIAGGGLLLLIILIAVFAGGGSDKKSTKVTKGSGSSAVIDMETPPGDNATSTIESAKSLIAAEDYEQAAAMLKDARKANPNNAEIAFLAGKAYFGKLWWADGVESFRAAIKLDPSYKDNADLLKTVLKGFLTTPDVDDRIVGFMRRDIGPPMRPYLEETAEKHPKKALRARASAELNAGK